MTRLLCMRLGTGQPGATLVTCILRDGSPRTQADMWSRMAQTAPSTCGTGLRWHTRMGSRVGFAQVSVEDARVDYSGNCRNMSAAMGPFAVDEGLVKTSGDQALVRIHNTNTRK